MALNLAAIIASSEQGVVLPWLIARSRSEAAAVLWCAGFSDKPEKKKPPSLSTGGFSVCGARFAIAKQCFLRNSARTAQFLVLVVGPE